MGDQSRRRLEGGLHWLSASFLALTLVIVIGAFIPSLAKLHESPSAGSAVLWDLVIGLVGGALTFLLTTLSGAAGDALSLRARRLTHAQQPDASRWSWRASWSLRELGRMLLLSVAGVWMSAASTEVFVSSSSTTLGVAADTRPRNPSAWGSLVAPLVVWFLATGLVWFAFGLRQRKRRETRPRTDEQTHTDEAQLKRRRRATHASAVAIVLTILIGWPFTLILNGLIAHSLAARGRPAGALISTGPRGERVQRLAQQFVPQFELARGEHWDPTTVSWYMGHSQLTTTATYCMATKKPLRQGCRQLCTGVKGGRCVAVCDGPDAAGCSPPRGTSPAAVYYRYEDAATAPRNDRPAHPAHRRWAVIQYWIFYNYDSLDTAIITQWHQSDWEQVSVLLQRRSSRMVPVDVAFSEHCYGAVVPASEVLWHGSHPISFVGRGSHANYPTRRDEPIRQLQCMTRQTPRYLGVAGLFFNPRIAGWSIELPVLYLIGARDTTGGGRTVSNERAIPLNATAAISSFSGYWGTDNNVQIVAGGFATGAGPQSPQTQPPSLQPFRYMFCNPTWLRLRSTSATRWVC